MLVAEEAEEAARAERSNKASCTQFIGLAEGRVRVLRCILIYHFKRQ